MTPSSFSRVLPFIVLLLVGGCKARSASQLASLPAANSTFADWKTYDALARLLENYGPIDGIAGGSSASATSFLYESVYMNPAVWACGEPAIHCTERETANRMAFLMKSMREFVQVLGDRADFALAATAIPKLVKEFQDKEYLTAMAAQDFFTAAKAVIRILSGPEFKGIVDFRTVSRLQSALYKPDVLKRELAEINGSIKVLDWSIDGPGIFLRRGFLNIEELAKRVGWAGDFYAGLDPAVLDDLKRLLDSCAEDGVGATWRETFSHSLSDRYGRRSPSIAKTYQTCGDFYRGILNGYLARTTNNKQTPKRMTQLVGRTVPTLVSTSIYDSVPADNYMRSEYLVYSNTGNFSAQFEASWLRFGYWGTAGDLARVEANHQGYKDIKTVRFKNLGEAQWGEALRVSPQEPGLGSVLCNYQQGTPTQQGKWESYSYLPEGTKCLKWSLGGWADLAPVQVLKNMGCEKVVYVTRQDDESLLIRKVSEMLDAVPGKGSSIQEQLLNLDGMVTSADNQQVMSSAMQAITAQSAALCTDWDSIEAPQLDCLGDNAYTSPLLTSDEFFKSLGDNSPRAIRLKNAGFAPYKDARSGPPLRGCLLGAGPQPKENKRPNPCK